MCKKAIMFIIIFLFGLNVFSLIAWCWKAVIAKENGKCPVFSFILPLNIINKFKVFSVGFQNVI